MRKIIRDKIPAIAAGDCNPMTVTVVDDKTALEYLIQKLDEEVAELKAEMEGTEKFGERILFEMADVYETMDQIRTKWLRVYGGTGSVGNKTIVSAAKDKVSRKGSFTQNYILTKED